MHGVKRNKLEKFVLWARVNLSSQESRGISTGRYNIFGIQFAYQFQYWALHVTEGTRPSVRMVVSLVIPLLKP